ncbi:MAG: TIGR04211 family SH3 domain-containing protein [Immundisolibacter sp.]|uniref:TIGR04211 family SH3 domain-containing protein n=1 Tax=Immundisolibacter sp. TaxID=1934948 RepID=UPI003D09EB8E
MTRNRSVFLLALAVLLNGRAAAVEPAATASTTAAADVDPVRALRALQREHDALVAQQPALQESVAKAAALADQNRQLDQQLQNVQAQLDGLREENAGLRTDERRRWFVNGAAVLGCGLLLGLLLPLLRGRRRRGYGGFR